MATYLRDHKHNPHEQGAGIRECSPIDFREGKLYQVMHGKCSALGDKDADWMQTFEIADGAIIMFLEPMPDMECYDQCGIKMLFGEKILYFTGALCTGNWKEV